jgi:hypothetical protein
MTKDISAERLEKEYDVTELNEQLRQIAAMQEYGKLGLEMPGLKQQLRLNPITTAYGLPNRYPGNVPITSAPSTLSYIGQNLAQTGAAALGYYAAGQLLNAAPIPLAFEARSRSERLGSLTPLISDPN